MISSDLTARADAMITPDMVVRRMLDLMTECASCEPDPYLMTKIIEHKRRADRSTCGCPYCTAIKTYVAAKLLVRRLERQCDGMSSRITQDRLQDAYARLAARMFIKDQAKLIDISGWVGADSA